MRNLLWRALKWFLFRLDAESVHRFTVALIQAGIRLHGLPLRLVSGARGRTAAISVASPGRGAPAPAASTMAVVWGLSFRSRLGLAAGFDKDAEILEGLPELGFGFAEIGTVTPRPQPGNDRPRLFREPARQAIFNRMGFNGLGATIVSERLREARPELPSGFRVGINIGKNKDTPNEQASEDYVRAAASFEGLADYLVINVSSPNTPGLRSLQALDSLRPIVERVNDLISSWKARPPLLLKLAPEVRGEGLRSILEAGPGWGIDGWVLTNTLAGNIELPPEPGAPARSLPGGWSGAPLTEASRASLVEARALTRLPIISVGGILTPEEAALRLRLGADLVQVYSGWVFGGPAFPENVAKELAKS